MGNSDWQTVSQEGGGQGADLTQHGRVADEVEQVVVQMDEVRWQVGEMLYLQQVGSPSVRYAVRLIGYLKHKSIIVTAPVAEGRVMLVRDGQTFVVRAFSGKKAYAFMASALRAVHSPYPYLHLSYPKEVRYAVVRRSMRAHVRLIAAVSSKRNAAPVAVTLVDLSVGGTSAVCKERLAEEGATMQVKFRVTVTGQDEYLSLNALLRSVTHNEAGNDYRHGFEFVDLPKQAQLVLSAYVHQVLAEGE